MSEFTDILDRELEAGLTLDEADIVLDALYLSPDAHRIINQIQSRPDKIYSKTPGTVVTLKI